MTITEMVETKSSMKFAMNSMPGQLVTISPLFFQLNGHNQFRTMNAT